MHRLTDYICTPLYRVVISPLAMAEAVSQSTAPSSPMRTLSRNTTNLVRGFAFFIDAKENGISNDAI
jgi:hypothetical protein